jgi:hypothetical protein
MKTAFDITIRDEDTPARIGQKLAVRFMWDGNQIMDCFIAALVDANHHTLANQIEKLYNEGQQ